MARSREYSYEQTVMLPVALGRQLQPGSLEYAINHLVAHCVDRNDETGAPAIDPAVVLKIVLCPDTRPHFTTIASFISSMEAVIVGLFRKVATLKKREQEIVSWTPENEERIGCRGKTVKSNITDNESAKLVSSHRVIQGYNGIATVDAKPQIVVDAQAFGDVHEAAHVKEIIESVVVTADPRFADQHEHKAKTISRSRVAARTGRARATPVGLSKDIHSTAEYVRCALSAYGVLFLRSGRSPKPIPADDKTRRA